MPVGKGGYFRFFYVEEPLGHGMPDTLGVGA